MPVRSAPAHSTPIGIAPSALRRRPADLPLACRPGRRPLSRPPLSTLVVPQAAGGTNDIIVGRIVAQKLGELSVGTVVENRPGAGGNIGTRPWRRPPGTAIHC